MFVGIVLKMLLFEWNSRFRKETWKACLIKLFIKLCKRLWIVYKLFIVRASNWILNKLLSLLFTSSYCIIYSFSPFFCPYAPLFFVCVYSAEERTRARFPRFFPPSHQFVANLLFTLSTTPTYVKLIELRRVHVRLLKNVELNLKTIQLGTVGAATWNINENFIIFTKWIYNRLNTLNKYTFWWCCVVPSPCFHLTRVSVCGVQWCF